MIIPLDEKNRIRGTESCWQLESSNKNGEWQPYKYFPSIGSALREAAQREIRTSETRDLSEALAACEAVTAKYARIFDQVGKRPKGVA